MKLTILGSGAAEGFPAVFCNCKICTEAWKRGGKDFRMRSAYRLNERVRVDFGPDTLAQEQRFALHSDKLRHLIISHSHSDHLYPELLEYRYKGFSHMDPDNILNLYGNIGVLKKVRQTLVQEAFEGYRINLVELREFEPVEVPEEDMTIYPLPANHMPEEKPNIFVLRQGKKHILIGNDTGVFFEPVRDWFAKQSFVLDLAILDGTGGATQPWRINHMGERVPLEMRDLLREMGRIDGHTKVYINHFSHNGLSLHSDMEEYYNPQGIEVGFDGCEIEY